MKNTQTNRSGSKMDWVRKDIKDESCEFIGGVEKKHDTELLYGKAVEQKKNEFNKEI